MLIATFRFHRFVGDAKLGAKKVTKCEEHNMKSSDDHVCLVHVGRAFKKAMWARMTKDPGFSTFLRSQEIDPQKYKASKRKWTAVQRRQEFRKHFIDACLRRSATEWALIHDAGTSMVWSTDEDRIQWLIRECDLIAKGIVRCFMGDHSKCPHWSQVCTHNNSESDYTPRHLPNAEYLRLTAEDQASQLAAMS